MSQSVLDVINQQIEEARTDLLHYRPHEMDWSTRARATAQTLIPWLTSEMRSLGPGRPGWSSTHGSVPCGPRVPWGSPGPGRSRDYSLELPQIRACTLNAPGSSRCGLSLSLTRLGRFAVTRW